MASLTVMPPLPEPECSRSYLISSSETLLLSADAWPAPRRPATQRQRMPGRELHTRAAALVRGCTATTAAYHMTACEVRAMMCASAGLSPPSPQHTWPTANPQRHLAHGVPPGAPVSVRVRPRTEVPISWTVRLNHSRMPPPWYLLAARSYSYLHPTSPVTRQAGAVANSRPSSLHCTRATPMRQNDCVANHRRPESLPA